MRAGRHDDDRLPDPPTLEAVEVARDDGEPRLFVTHHDHDHDRDLDLDDDERGAVGEAAAPDSNALLAAAIAIGCGVLVFWVLFGGDFQRLIQALRARH